MHEKDAEFLTGEGLGEDCRSRRFPLLVHKIVDFVDFLYLSASLKITADKIRLAGETAEISTAFSGNLVFNDQNVDDFLI